MGLAGTCSSGLVLLTQVVAPAQVGSLLRSPMDHLQRPEHPSAEAGPSLPVLGGAGHGCSGSRGWLVAITGVMQWQGSVPSERGKSHLELVARGGPTAWGEPSP